MREGESVIMVMDLESRRNIIIRGNVRVENSR